MIFDGIIPIMMCLDPTISQDPAKDPRGSYSGTCKILKDPTQS